jgi:hypothetical protein
MKLTFYKYNRKGKDKILGYGGEASAYLKGAKPLFIYCIKGQRFLYNSYWREIKDVKEESIEVQKEIFEFLISKDS